MVEVDRVAAESQLQNPVVSNWLFNPSRSLSRLFCPYQFNSSFSMFRSLKKIKSQLSMYCRTRA